MTDVSCGDWLLERVGDPTQVGGATGTGFEAYVRILHPVPAHRGDEQSRWPWSEVARRVGATMHPLVQWNRLADVHDGPDFADGWKVGQTPDGFLELDLLAALTEHLSVATSTPGDLVAGFWNGWSELSGRGMRYVERGPRGWLAAALGRDVAAAEVTPAPEVRAAAARGPFLRCSEVEMIAFATSVDEIADPGWAERAGLGVEPGAHGLSPQLLWPEDHVWVVASEIDRDSTIVAGPRSLVAAVLADDRLEAYEVDEDSDLSWEGDLVNPPRAGWPGEL